MSKGILGTKTVERLKKLITRALDPCSENESILAWSFIKKIMDRNSLTFCVLSTAHGGQRSKVLVGKDSY